MAGSKESNAQEESSPLLNQQQFQELVKRPKPTRIRWDKSTEVVMNAGGPRDGLPLTHGSVVAGELMGRSQWDSDLLACLGRNDDF